VKISIVTSVFNNKSYIEDCIKSVLNQTYQNIEYIIIDGGSTDGTLDVIKKYNDKIAKWISEPDNGIYDALNKGIRLASGNIVGFLHADDVYAHNKLY
jgi:glycosyltransferase